MLTQGDDVEVHALAARGWSISAIARHIERDRKTVRAYLRGDRTPGVRARSVPDPLEPFIGYISAAVGVRVVPCSRVHGVPSWAPG